LYRKGKTASELRYMGHTLSDNRHGLVVSALVSTADGHAEREAAKVMLNDARQAAVAPESCVFRTVSFVRSGQVLVGRSSLPTTLLRTGHFSVLVRRP